MFSVGANSELEITALVTAKYMRMVVNHPQPNFLTHTKRRGSNKLQGGEGNRCLEAAVELSQQVCLQLNTTTCCAVEVVTGFLHDVPI